MAPEDPIDVSDDLVDDEGSVSACETLIKLIKTCYDLMIWIILDTSSSSKNNLVTQEILVGTIVTV